MECVWGILALPGMEVTLGHVRSAWRAPCGVLLPQLQSSSPVVVLLLLVTPHPCAVLCCPSALQIHVYPKDHAKAIAAVTATHTKKAAEGQSRAERRKTQYTSRKTPVVSVATVAVPVRP